MTPVLNIIDETLNLYTRTDGANWVKGTYHTNATDPANQQHCMIGGVEQAFFQLITQEESTYQDGAGQERDLDSVYQVAGDERMHASVLMLAQVVVDLFPQRFSPSAFGPPAPSAASFVTNETIVIAFNDHEETTYQDVLDVLHTASDRQRAQLADDGV